MKFLKKLIVLSLVHFLFLSAQAGQRCHQLLSKKEQSVAQKGQWTSFFDVVKIMEMGAYSQRPVIPVQVMNFFREGRLHLEPVVLQRSIELLEDTADYRSEGVPKPIHPMGEGLTGLMRMKKSRWSGAFAGGDFLVAARASISQGNPFLVDQKGRPQVRSTAMALKVWGTTDPEQRGGTANLVFQNDLNGLLGPNGNEALRYLQSSQTNHPDLKIFKIRHLYEAITLGGIAVATLKNKLEKTGEKVPVNPQIRPVHSLAEMGVSDSEDVKTPVWVKIVPRVEAEVYDQLDPRKIDDFRGEISEVMKLQGSITYDFFAADKKDGDEREQWESVGEIIFDRSYSSQGVDFNLLFAHDTFNSAKTGELFVVPDGLNQFAFPPQDIQ